MNEVSQIALRSAEFSLVPQSLDEAGTALVAESSTRVTKKLIDWASTSPSDELERANREAAEVSFEALDRLRIAKAGASRTLSLAIMRARWWVETFSSFAAVEDLEFMTPSVTASPDDEVVLEWWSGARKLTLYVTGDGLEYVRAWGADMFAEMNEGRIESCSDAVPVWSWLAVGE
jgi:hypothetical protein